MLLFYQFFLFLFRFGSRVMSLRNPKARLWIEGRKGLIPLIAEKVRPDKGNIIWMHCASLGEFEQGRPLLEALRTGYPEKKLLLTFFSPSGYEIRKNYPGADHIFYMPLDSLKNAKQFLAATQPVLAIFIKYEFWYYYLEELDRRLIPTLLVSGIFREDQPFFKSYGSFWKKMLKNFSVLFVQNNSSVKLLQSIGLVNRTILSGDTRFDTVVETAGNFISVEGIENFCSSYPVIVAGSTWIEDEEVLDHFANSNENIRLILAPHEIFETHLKEIEKLFRHTIRYSRFMASGAEAGDANVLIIDNIGMLSRLYHYADITFVGGGFGADGIHNILEPAVYGKPVIFGPFYDKFQEAVDLLELGGAASVSSAVELEILLKEWLLKTETILEKGNIARQYVYERAGATQTIMRYIQENRLLTN